MQTRSALIFLAGAVTVAVLSVFMAVGAVVGRSAMAADGPQVVYQQKQIRLSAESSVSLPITLSADAYIDVDLVEQFGKNIEFKLLSNGLIVGSSGVKRGHAQGRFRAEAGMASVVIKNGNLLEGKVVVATVKALAVEGQ